MKTMGRVQASLTALISCLLMLVLTAVPVLGASYMKVLKEFDVKPLSDQDVKEGFTRTAGHSTLLECEYPSDCRDVQTCGNTKSGVYQVFPFGLGNGFPVFCDMVTDGGGWLVFQRRQDGTVDFHRKWQEYKDGFGNLYGEFWLGLEKLNLLTSQRDTKLLINMGSYDHGTGYAAYNRFRISDERENFRLFLGKFSGNVGDWLSYHNGIKFSTLDKDNDNHDTKNCAADYTGAWWHKGCYQSNLNGRYRHVNKKDMTDNTSANWRYWPGNYYPLQFVEMKMRSVDGD